MAFRNSYTASEINLNPPEFITNDMSVEQKADVWQKEYFKLYARLERDRLAIKQYQEENQKLEKMNELGLKLVENLRNQITKYQENNSVNTLDPKAIAQGNIEDIDSWQARYWTEKRTSEYLRAECEDLQNEIEEMKQQKTSSHHPTDTEIDSEHSDKLQNVLKIVNEAWELEVTTLIEQFKTSEMSFENIEVLKKEIDKKKDEILSKSTTANVKTSANGNGIDYKHMFEESVRSKIELIEKTSREIQRLRKIIFSQNTTLYRNLFDRIARYHNLDGQEDTLFQLMIDAELQKRAKNK